MLFARVAIKYSEGFVLYFSPDRNQTAIEYPSRVVLRFEAASCKFEAFPIKKEKTWDSDTRLYRKMVDSGHCGRFGELSQPLSSVSSFRK